MVEHSLSPARLEGFAADFGAKPERRALSNAVAQAGLNIAALNRAALARTQYNFSVEVETGKVTNQKKSGRCWLFAGLNNFRHEAEKKHNLVDFELSQAYPFFWDKLEKANYFLESILETAAADVGDRTVMWLLTTLVQDGGQWDMYVDLVRKYGVLPKGFMSEAFQSEQSAELNLVLRMKLREDAAALRAAFRAGVGLDDLRERKNAMLNEIYRILAIVLGEPPRTFDFEYRDKDKNFHRLAACTPVSFYKDFIGVAADDYVSIINAPTADKPFGRTYTVQYLGNVVGGRGVLYLNLEIEAVKALALAQLSDGESVWFGCDMGHMVGRDSGLMDRELFAYAGALDTPFKMTKAESLDYRESCLTHAMLFTGVNVVDGRPDRWKVENSWGDQTGNKGYFVMDNRWFEDYLYQIVVHKKYLSEDMRRALEAPPIVLPPWDPMGSLALTF